MAHVRDLVLERLHASLGADGVTKHRSFARLLELDRAILQLAYPEDWLDGLSDFMGMKRTLI